MREILFRGKRVGIEEWVEGFYLTSPEFDNQEIAVITTDKPRNPWYVSKETVGQFTGLTDKNGKKIFEGDIVTNEWYFIKGVSVVKFGHYKTLDMDKDFQQGHLGFYLEHNDLINLKSVRRDMMYFANKCEVIGNIHNNPKLLKEREGK